MYNATIQSSFACANLFVHSAYEPDCNVISYSLLGSNVFSHQTICKFYFFCMIPSTINNFIFRFDCFLSDSLLYPEKAREKLRFPHYLICSFVKLQ